MQPVSLAFDNTKQNVSTITGTVIETITEDYPKGQEVPQDRVTKLAALSNDSCAQVYAANAVPDEADKTSMNSNIYSFKAI